MSFVCGIVSVVIWAQGCLVICTEDTPDDEPSVIVVEADRTTREIDAVRALSFEQQRKDAYMRIAAREDLSEAAQIRLVEAAYKHLSFEQNRVDLLLAIIANPSFCPEAEATILNQLSRLHFEQHRSRVLRAISEQQG
jgi:hypothetical protein